MTKSSCTGVLVRRARTKRVSRDSGLVFDVNANLYPSRDGSKSFYMCAAPKTGCSQWIMLLNYLLTGRKFHSGDVHRSQARKAAVLNFKSESTYDTLNDVNVARVLVMRNPYDRVVSSYHDFLRRNADSVEHKNVTFEHFVKYFVSSTSVWQSWDKQPHDHRSPITAGCNIWDKDKNTFLLEWDFILRLEEMILWSECLLNELQLQNIVRRGWRTPTGRLFKKGIDLSASTENGELAKRIINNLPWPHTREVTVGHESINQTGRELYTAETVDIVNQVFKVDFQVGGYPLWDGVL